VKIGLISDVHANVIALEAALEALEERGAEVVVCLGDLVGYGPSPNETIELLRDKGVHCTLGAADERVAYSFAGPAAPRKGVADDILEWTKSVLEPENLRFLQSLAVQQRLQTPLGWLRYFHGSHDNPSERLNLNRDPISLGRMLERHRCNILVAGSTHVPFYRHIGDNGLVLNPGSVGLSLNGEPGADYALLTITDSGLELEMDKVEYDFAAAAFEVLAWGLPAAVAEAVQHGRMTERLGSGPDGAP